MSLAGRAKACPRQVEASARRLEVSAEVMRGDSPRVELPSLDAYSDVPLYNTKAVVHQTGVPAPTLRAWERRYGIVAPQRGGNEYRLYSERDIVTVIWLRERVQTGMTISQAIALLKSLQSSRQPARRADREPAPPHGQTNGHGVAAPVGRPDGYALDELQSTLLHELGNLDEFAARRTMAQAMAVHPVEAVCTGLLAPVLKQIGQLWADGALNVVTEHFATNVVRSHLESIFRNTGELDGGPLALVGCAPGELHEMGALMFALFLRRAGIRVAYLGQAVEADGLIETSRVVRPAVIVLGAVMSESVQPLQDVAKVIADLPGQRPTFAFGGRAFEQQPELAAMVPGLYLDGDLQRAAATVRSRLGR